MEIVTRGLELHTGGPGTALRQFDGISVDQRAGAFAEGMRARRKWRLAHPSQAAEQDRRRAADRRLEIEISKSQARRSARLELEIGRSRIRRGLKP